jgi:ketosteroid isomerase-like protein
MVNTVERNDIRFEGIQSLCPDVEIDVSELPGGRILRGREAVHAYWQSLRTDVWKELSMEVETMTEQDHVVIALVRFDGVGRGSGIPVEMGAGWVVTVRDGLVASARLTLDRGLVLQAAGASTG